MEFYNPNELNDDLFEKHVHRSSFDISRPNSVMVRQRLKSTQPNNKAQIKNKKLVTILTNKMFRGYLKVKAIRDEKEKVITTVYANNKKFCVTTKSSNEKNLMLTSSGNDFKLNNPLTIEIVKEFGLDYDEEKKSNKTNFDGNNFFITHKRNVKQYEDEQKIKSLFRNIYNDKHEIEQYNKLTFIAFDTKKSRKSIDERNKVIIEKEMLNDIANINKNLNFKRKDERIKSKGNVNMSNGNPISFKDMFIMNNDSNNFEISLVTEERMNRLDTRKFSNSKSSPKEERIGQQLTKNSHSTLNIKKFPLQDEKIKFNKIRSNLFQTKAKKTNNNIKKPEVNAKTKKNYPLISDLIIAPNEEYETHHVPTTISESFFSQQKRDTSSSYKKKLKQSNKSKDSKKDKFNKLKEIVFGSTRYSLTTPNTMRRTATTNFDTGTTNTLYSNLPVLKRNMKTNENRQRDAKISKMLYKMFEKDDVDKVIYGKAIQI